MNELNRSAQNLRNELDIQLRLLRKASHEFDLGDIEEFRNIARALRVIISGDDHGNKSLLELAGQEHIAFLDTGMTPHPNNIIPYFSLAGIVLGSQTIGCRAFLGDSIVNRSISYSNWMNETIIDDKEGGAFNRLRLVKAVANFAGGTHYPPDIRSYFAKLQKLGVTAKKHGLSIEQEYRDVDKHSIRQIAHELIVTFDRSYTRYGQFETGAVMMARWEMIPYPGRKLKTSAFIGVKETPGVFSSAGPNQYDGIAGPMAKLPYEGANSKAPCVCGSSLTFAECCKTPHEFSPEFIEEFEKSLSLPS